MAAGEWNAAAKLDTFYQTLTVMRAVPAEGRTEAYVGYTDDALYIAVKGYEDDTSTLAASHSTRDSNVWRDDCADLFFDVNLDQRTFYQLTTNSIGAIFDINYDAKTGGNGGAGNWNGLQRVGTKVEPTFWVMEMELPFASFGEIEVERGDIWGFNASRVRIANAAEYNQWTPTYGLVLRPDYFGMLVFD